MSTTLTEVRPRFAAFLDDEDDLIILDRLHPCETGFAFYGMADAERICEHMADRPRNYYLCDPLGTFPPGEDTPFVDGVGGFTATLPARYTAAPATKDEVAGFVLRDHQTGLEAFFVSTSLSEVAMAIETNQAVINERLDHARQQFVGHPSLLGAPIGTHPTTGPEFLVTPLHEIGA